MSLSISVYSLIIKLIKTFLWLNYKISIWISKLFCSFFLLGSLSLFLFFCFLLLFITLFFRWFLFFLLFYLRGSSSWFLFCFNLLIFTIFPKMTFLFTFSTNKFKHAISSWAIFSLMSQSFATKTSNFLYLQSASTSNMTWLSTTMAYFLFSTCWWNMSLFTTI